MTRHEVGEIPKPRGTLAALLRKLVRGPGYQRSGQGRPPRFLKGLVPRPALKILPPSARILVQLAVILPYLFIPPTDALHLVPKLRQPRNCPIVIPDQLMDQTGLALG